MGRIKMKRTTKIIIIIILIILALLLFTKLTGFIIRSTGTAINTCTDTDSGKDYYTLGEVFGDRTYITQVEDYNYKDTCKNEQTLIEYYCIKENLLTNSPTSIDFNCPEGCDQENNICLGTEPEPTETPQKTSLLQKIINWFGF